VIGRSEYCRDMTAVTWPSSWTSGTLRFRPRTLVDPKRTHLSDHYPEPREEVAKSLFCTVAEGPPGIIAYDVLDAQD
jgi:hypothetical protein